MRLEQLKNKSIYIVGISGIGMSAIAKILHKKGFKVGGSTDKKNDQTDHLQSLGLSIDIGHSSDNVNNSEVVIYSTAIDENHVERVSALKQNKVLWNRRDFFPILFSETKNIAISGTHGKTTTTTMVGHLFRCCDEDVSMLIGAMWDEIGSNEVVGESPYFVVEADESDGSFLSIPSFISVVNNVDKDHMNYYKTMDNLLSSYKQFINQTIDGGVALFNGDDPYLMDLSSDFKVKSMSYGFSDHCNIMAYDLRFEKGSQFFRLKYQGEDKGEFQLNVLGHYNVQNSLVALGMGLYCDLNVEAMKKGLMTYQLPKRRMEKKGTWNDMDIIDDYAHHPFAVQQAILGVKKYYGEKIIVVFQPHRYTRTADTFKEMVDVLSTVDKAYLLPLYTANEEPLEGINSIELARCCGAMYVEEMGELVLELKNFKDYGAVLFMGAGDISQWASSLVDEN